MEQKKQVIFYQGVPIESSTEKKLNRIANKTGTAMHDVIGRILDLTVDMIVPSDQSPSGVRLRDDRFA